ncbi:unnamed protein product [Cunninghamella blakesleeana]
MLLLDLPYEILDNIFDKLPQKTLTRLCTVNQKGYELCIPTLYRHLHIKNRTYFKQLEKGLKRSTFLQHVITTYTRTLTITCEQSSYQWLISRQQASWCQKWLKNTHTITFCHFDMLPIDQIGEFLYRLNSLHNIQLHYCNLICQNQPEPLIPMLPDTLNNSSIYQLPATYTYHQQQPSSSIHHYPLESIKKIEFLWTDFSSTAITTLFSMLPELTFVHFGANHNRLENANTLAIKSLKHYCSKIQGLHIRLQQIEPTTLSEVITHYGHQLINLGIQCQDKHVLKTVAQHANNIKQLTLHASPVLSSALEEDNQEEMEDTSLIKDHYLWRTDDKNNNIYHYNHLNKNEKKTLDNIIDVVQQCGQLIYMEMVSWGVQDIPSILFQIKDEKQNHSLSRCSSTSSLSSLASSSSLSLSSFSSSYHSYSQYNKTSLTLDSEVLNEIRTLFI